jgi:hypothetical protein
MNQLRDLNKYSNYLIDLTFLKTGEYDYYIIRIVGENEKTSYIGSMGRILITDYLE